MLIIIDVFGLAIAPERHASLPFYLPASADLADGIWASIA
jgi:hypothetical protein